MDIANIAILGFKAEAEFKTENASKNSSRVIAGSCEAFPSLLFGAIPTFTIDIGSKTYFKRNFQGPYYELTAGPRIAEHTPFISQVLNIDDYGGVWYGAQTKAIIGYKHIFKNGITLDTNTGLLGGLGIRMYAGDWPHALTPILGLDLDFRVGYSF